MNAHAGWWLAFLTVTTMAAIPSPAWAATAQIEARLICGTNEDAPKEQALADIEPKFQPDFGYKHYKLLGQQTVKLKEGENALLDLGHHFEIDLKHTGTQKKYHILQVNLFHKKQKLLFIELSVEQRSEPIFIKGPWTKHGLVIIALTAK